MPKYRKKPVVIEARQLVAGKWTQIAKWCGGEIVKDKLHDGWVFDHMRIKTLEGVMKANKYDWIIKGVSGEFYPCKPDIFEATYERVWEE